ncbi:MAG: O-antigen ligase, partial [Bacteroidota bacterium]|nr:O-antigen ligase [Bacteroidota bacterium]
ISLIILLIVIFLSLKKGNDMFSPGKAFLGVWSFCIFLTEFKFSGFQHQWSTYSWFVLLLGLFSFLVGIFITHVIFFDKPLLSISSIRERSLSINESTLKKLLYATVILFLLYIISFTVEVLIEGFVPIFSARPDKARVEFGLFGIHLLVNLQIALTFLAIEYIALTKKDNYKKKLAWGIFFITVLTFAFLLQRFNFFFGGLMILALLFYASRALTFKRVVVIGLFFSGFLWGIKSIRLSRYVSEFNYAISKMRFGKEYAIFTEPYMYITMNLENMAHAVDQLDRYVYGVQTFDWIYALSGIKHWMADYFHIDHREFLTSGYSTFPFHWYYYWDFGLLGVVLLPLLSGLVIGICYYMMRYTAQIKWVVLYSVCYSLIVISFFTNPILLLNFVSNIFVLWFVHHFFVNQGNVQLKVKDWHT